MIYDNLENISRYNQIPEPAKDFINNLIADIPLGRYEISDGIYANIEEYSTKRIEEAKFEAHRKYIDIQILLKGYERLDFAPINNRKIIEPYDESRDIEFFEYGNADITPCFLDGKNFVMLFGGELHAPQISPCGEKKSVKKVVVKVRI